MTNDPNDVSQKEYQRILSREQSYPPPLLSRRGEENIAAVIAHRSRREWKATPIEGWRGIDSLDVGEAPKREVTTR